mgnify:CR=1 FL=1
MQFIYLFCLLSIYNFLQNINQFLKYLWKYWIQMNKDISSSQFTQLFASLRQVVLKGKATFEAHFHILQIAPYS